MINGEKITLATNCYEKNIDMITSSGYAKKLFLTDNQCIDYRILMVGNVKNKKYAEERCEGLKAQGIIDDYFFGYDYYKNIKRQFKGCGRFSFLRRRGVRIIIPEILKQRKFKPFFDGIKYSISPMAALLVCPSRWLLYITEDVEIHSEKLEEWVSKSIDIMKKNDKVITAGVLMGSKDSLDGKETICKDWMKKEIVSEDEEFLYLKGFSDQCFLVDADRVKKTKEIFAEENESCINTYPIYASNSFEQRFCAYMRNHDLVRATYKNDCHVHLYKDH